MFLEPSEEPFDDIAPAFGWSDKDVIRIEQ